MIGHCPACDDDAILLVRSGKTLCSWCGSQWVPGGPVTREERDEERQQRARGLRRQGLSWIEVAYQVGYPTAAKAEGVVRRLIERERGAA